MIGRALVVGLGVSGTAAAEALLAAGADVRVVEPARGAALDERAARLTAAGAEVLRSDVDAGALLGGRSMVVPSPIVPPSAPLLRAAVDAGVEIVSEPELAVRLSGGRTRIVGVTGTNGKTTVTELLASCLGAPPAGNIGDPLTDLLSAPEPPPLVVAELSSFQLQFTSSLAPEVALVLNLAPDHLDWHGSFVAYGAAKSRIWRAQTGGQTAICNGDDAEAAGLLEAHPPPAPRGTFAASGRGSTVAGPPLASVSEGLVWAEGPWTGRVPVVRVDELAVAGPHTLANVCAVVAAAIAAGADPTALAAPLRAYRPGAHRLQRVAVVRDVAYVDDSKATNPHAAAAALASFPQGAAGVVWIAGGLNKGLTFEGLAPLLPGRVKAAVTIGASGPAIAAVARSAGVPVVEAGMMDEAVPAAAALASAGDTVLLAPACASMDQFANYAARGRAFADAVARLDAPATAGAGGPR